MGSEDKIVVAYMALLGLPPALRSQAAPTIRILRDCIATMRSVPPQVVQQTYEQLAGIMENSGGELPPLRSS